MKDHVEPKPSVVVQRFTFHSRIRRQGELVSNYVAELNKLSEHCVFGDSLQEMLRDRLVCGISDPRIQRRLLSEPDLTYKRAYDLASAMEAAERNALDLQRIEAPRVERILGVRDHERKPEPNEERETCGVPEEGNVYSSKIYRQTNQSRTRNESFPNCYRCGNRHPVTECRFKGAICFKCNKRDHLAKVCKGKPKQERYLLGERNWKETHRVECDDATGAEEYPEYNLFNLGDSSSHQFKYWPWLTVLKHHLKWILELPNQ